MREKVITITTCGFCPHYGRFGYEACDHPDGPGKDTYGEIPDWCPLPDYQEPNPPIARHVVEERSTNFVGVGQLAQPNRTAVAELDDSGQIVKLHTY